MIERKDLLEAYKRHNGWYEDACWRKDNGGELIDFCPYEKYDACGRQLRDDIIEFLTPHVYTMEEVRDVVNYGFIEVATYSGTYMYAIPAIIDNCDKWRTDLVFGTDDIEPHEWDEYGKTWRCWNMYPTEEERKAVGWNEM